MRVTVTGATGLIGRRLVGALTARGDDVTVLSRDPERARGALPGTDAVHWDPQGGPPIAEALAGRDGVVNLAGEKVDQRWSAAAKQRIRSSRETATRNLVAGLEAADPCPSVLVSASAVGYYGPHGDETLDEDTAPGGDFLAQVCVAWEREADAAARLGMRVVRVRTGVVLDAHGGALSTMIKPFKLGVGGPVAGGGQYVPWIHLDDVVGIYLRALDDESWTGAVNATAPEPVTNKAFSQALGRALHRPSAVPVPRLAVRALFGEMSEIVTEGQRVLPERTQALGYPYRYPGLDDALRAVLA